MFKNYDLYSNYDNVKINTNKFSVENPKAIVLIVHGMCEYKERYNDFIKYLNDNSYTVYSYDHRGHGESKVEDKFGYFGKNKGYERIVSDFKMVVDHIKLENPELKLYIFAHSMGTIVTRIFLQENSKSIDKLILCGAPNYQKMSNVGIYLAGIIKFFEGKYRSSKLLTNLSLGKFNKSVENPISKNNWISYNKDNVIKYDNDEKCAFTFTNQAYSDLFKMLSLIGNPKAFRYLNDNLKIKFIAGKDDPCIGGDKGFSESINVLKNAGFKNIDSKLYKNMRHEILNEDNKEEVYKDVVAFYDEVL